VATKKTLKKAKTGTRRLGTMAPFLGEAEDWIIDHFRGMSNYEKGMGL
jgi:hypothetical protein